MEKSSYKQIVKATGLFGGVQLLQIAVALFKNKFVAYLLGAEGVGLHGIYTSTIALINSIANLGLQNSAVREVAQSHSSGDEQHLSTITTVVKKLVALIGVCALLSMAIASPLLSQWTMGDDTHTIAFAWLSLSLLFEQLSMGQLILLQGLQKYNYLAKANAIGALLGLAISVPLYYVWGIDGIVPAIILSSLFLLLRTWFFTRKLNIKRVPLTWRETLSQGGDMMRLGFVMAITSFIGTGAIYLVRIHLTHKGGVELVGFYNAAFILVDNYVGMVFNAMSTDYFPRLSAVNNDNKTCQKLVNEQGEISLIILLPLIMILTTFAPLVVRILYSSEFLPIVPIIQWALLGVVIKAIAFPFGFVYIAKGDKGVYLIKEILSWGVLCVAMLVGYHYFGLRGLGVGYLAGYIYSLIQTLIINRVRYGIRMKRLFGSLMCVSFTFLTLNFVIIQYIETPQRYYLSTLLIVASILFSAVQLNRRIDIKELIHNKIIKKLH